MYLSIIEEHRNPEEDVPKGVPASPYGVISFLPTSLQPSLEGTLTPTKGKGLPG